MELPIETVPEERRATLNEAMLILGVSQKTVYQRLKTGELDHCMHDRTRLVVLPPGVKREVKPELQPAPVVDLETVMAVVGRVAADHRHELAAQSDAHSGVLVKLGEELHTLSDAHARLEETSRALAAALGENARLMRENGRLEGTITQLERALERDRRRGWIARLVGA